MFALATGLTTSVFACSDKEGEKTPTREEVSTEKNNLEEFAMQLANSLNAEAKEENQIVIEYDAERFREQVLTSAILVNINQFTEDELVDYLEKYRVLDVDVVKNLEEFLDLNSIMVNYYIKHNEFPADYQLLVEDDKSKEKVAKMQQIIEDSEAKPEDSLERARELLEEDMTMGDRLLLKRMSIPVVANNLRTFPENSQELKKVKKLQNIADDVKEYMEYWDSLQLEEKLENRGKIIK